MKLTCPHCQESFHLSATATVPENQRFKVSCESETGNLLGADTVGRLLTDTSKLLRTLARDLDVTLTVFVDAIRLDGAKFEADLVLIENKPKGNTRITRTTLQEGGAQ